MATLHRHSLTAPEVTYRSVTDDIAAVPLHYPSPRAWWTGFACCLAAVAMFIAAAGWLFYRGLGIWGLQSPVFSGMLLLLNRGWRNSLNRFAEAMTAFAVIQAGIIPILHLGRPWLFYWLIP